MKKTSKFYLFGVREHEITLGYNDHGRQIEKFETEEIVATFDTEEMAKEYINYHTLPQSKYRFGPTYKGLLEGYCGHTIREIPSNPDYADSDLL